MILELQCSFIRASDQAQIFGFGVPATSSSEKKLLLQGLSSDGGYCNKT